jgi:geranylgeranyl diphosphate synthase type I
MEMIRLKTGVLLELSLKAGAILGGGTKVQIANIGNFGVLLGEAFQIKDDLLDLTVGADTLGKPMGSDIVAGKRTLIMVHALQYAQEKDKDRLREVIHMPEKKINEKAVKEAIDILHRAGSIEYAKNVVDELTKEAYRSLDVLPETKGKEALEALYTMAEYMMLREY